MPHHHRRKKRRFKLHSLTMVALYALILGGLICAGFLWDTPEAEPTFGSMEGRFDSDIRLAQGEDTLNYRENEITNILCIIQDRDLPAPTGEAADILLLLSLDRRHLTVTPTMIDADTLIAVQTEAGEEMLRIGRAQMMGGDATAAAVSNLLQGINVDRWLLVDRTGVGMLSDMLSGETTASTKDMTDHMEASVSLRTLYNEAQACSRYDWQPLRRPAGTYSRDAMGEYIFTPDADALRDMVIEIWFD